MGVRGAPLGRVMADVSILVPYRPDGGRRDEIWAWMRARWERVFPEFEIVVGVDDGPEWFNKSKAANRAAAEASGDVFILADTDVLVPDDNIVHGIELAVETGRFVMPFTDYHYLDKWRSDQIMRGVTSGWRDGVGFSLDGSVGGLNILTREAWFTIGGGDERFVGWGGEDVALFLAADRLVGTQRIDGDMLHLWHPLQVRDADAGWRRLLEQYEAADTPEAMSALVASR